MEYGAFKSRDYIKHWVSPGFEMSLKEIRSLLPLLLLHHSVSAHLKEGERLLEMMQVETLSKVPTSWKHDHRDHLRARLQDCRYFFVHLF